MPFPTLPDPLSRALAFHGYTEPTTVQSAVLGAGTAGRDLLVSAQTGSGKTVAFGLAFAPQLLSESDRPGPAATPLALVIAPTRELALQVRGELAWLYAEAGVHVVPCVGGTDMRAERRLLAQGVHIVVGTPGRLHDHIERGNLDLTALRVVVLDEADEMLDMGFREELEAILDVTPAATVFRDDPARDRGIGKALPARRAAHCGDRRGAGAPRYRVPCHHRRTAGNRPGAGQHPALVR
jgi:ATP-dependent RNA helicase DeaD